MKEVGGRVGRVGKASKKFNVAKKKMSPHVHMYMNMLPEEPYQSIIETVQIKFCQLP